MPRIWVGALAASSVSLLVAAATFLVCTHIGVPAERATAPIKPPPPTPHWTGATLHQLLDAVNASRAEGLRPQDYRRDELAGALRTGGRVATIDALATGSAHALAHDYADGRVTHRATRFDWHIPNSTAALATMDADIADAVNGGRLTAYLHGLLPQDRRYAALRAALDATPDSEAARHDAIRASMERWRWMPRALGTNYIWVNVPSYRLAFYRGDRVAAIHDVVVGAPETPTPMLSATVGSIIVNPWWTLPPTVLREGKRYAPEKGYVYQTIGGRIYVRQRPGPMNALGRMKIDMPNAWAIYLHDTPAKSGFLRTDRALSHGCIRVKDIATLATQLYDPAAIDGALQTYQMKTLEMPTRLPVYIVYFTAAPDANGQIVTYGDPYARDPELIAALNRDPTASGTKKNTAIHDMMTPVAANRAINTADRL
ncbi:L,D-transpeptidase family protein [Sphingomonas abietis]|uniref:L,D-transpeptidase family protein n=1 Tax=Sphingomonas abietis TaxID=3012344 RepID=A0ABY7NPH5_9SPHN|nr:L,D-transpeptidase family protein [Sphingomonas abietis]WBO23423.1 L,D-transpeptidase family protein [Sphingomonas abietis]